jgi:FixJ family two-component response regulator
MTANAHTDTPTVFLIDDDPGVLKGLARLLRTEGWRVETSSSAEEFLARFDPLARGCLVLDVTLPGLTGIELQEVMKTAGNPLPIVFLTGHGDIPMSVKAIKAGAADFLTKPVQAAELLHTVQAAIAQDAAACKLRNDTAQLQQRFASLTRREREVLAGMAAGKLNKQIAADLGIVEQTVKFHRARVMERMQARSLAELMLIVAKVGGGSAPPAADAEPAN